MTDEGEAETVKWVEEKGAKYAYGYDRGGKLASYFKGSGIPAAVPSTIHVEPLDTS